MKSFKILVLFFLFLTNFSFSSLAQNTKDKILTPEYLSGIWSVRHIDTVFNHRQELKLKFNIKNNFEQWIEIDGKISDVHKGKFKIQDNLLVFFDNKKRENIYRIVQVGLISFSVREKNAKDIITFVRE